MGSGSECTERTDTSRSCPSRGNGWCLRSPRREGSASVRLRLARRLKRLEGQSLYRNHNRELPGRPVEPGLDRCGSPATDRGMVVAEATVLRSLIAIAAVHGMDYLLTWNCKHIANAQMQKTVAEICRAAGYEPPTICTPE